MTLTDFLVFSGVQPCLLWVNPQTPLTNPALPSPLAGHTEHCASANATERLLDFSWPDPFPFDPIL